MDTTVVLLIVAVLVVAAIAIGAGALDRPRRVRRDVVVDRPVRRARRRVVVEEPVDEVVETRRRVVD